MSLPKLCGADVELGNFVVGLADGVSSDGVAARCLLRRFEGRPLRPEPASCQCSRCRGEEPVAERWLSRWLRAGSEGRPSGSRLAGFDAQDWGRCYLPSNGGCVYIDLNHLELCTPEVIRAADHVAVWHAMLRLARRALHEANAALPAGQRIQVLVNNSDGKGHAYGSHLSVLVTRPAFERIFHRRLHHLLHLATYQASSLIFTGQGKVGSENGAPDVRFQLSQRADFFETLVGPQTTWQRPIVNSRDESLCGSLSSHARLHVIFYDSNLCHVAHLLKVGVLQVVLAMIEAEQVDPALILEDPVEAVQRFSFDPTLRASAPLVSGQALTALEVQWRFLERARAFADAGRLEGVVPDGLRILELWEDTLARLEAGDDAVLVRRLDWKLKQRLIESVLGTRPDLDWSSPEAKLLDDLYSSLDEDEGLYWAWEREGRVERVADHDAIDRFTREPPDDTRAWTRAHLLRLAPAGDVQDVDWDRIRLRSGRSKRTNTRTLQLPDPLGLTRAESEAAFAAGSLAEVLDALGADRTEPPVRPRTVPAEGATLS